MLSRCRNDREDALVRRMFRNKNERRDARRWQQWQARRGFSNSRAADQQVNSGNRISFSSRIFARNLLVSPGPQGRHVSFGDLESAESQPVQSSSRAEHSPINEEVVMVDTSLIKLENLVETPPIANVPKKDNTVDPSPFNSPEDHILIGNNPNSSLEGSPLEDSSIDMEFVRSIDMTTVTEKIKVIRKSGDSQRANQLREDGWIVRDLQTGSKVDTKPECVVPAINRIIELVLLEVDPNPMPSTSAESSSTAENVPSQLLVDPTEEEASEEPIEGVIEEAIAEGFEGAVDSGTFDFAVVSSEAPDPNNSEDEFYDCLEDAPYDPIDENFFN